MKYLQIIMNIYKIKYGKVIKYDRIKNNRPK